MGLGWAKSTHVLNENGNNIGDIGAISIADSLKENCTLKSLDLSRNKIKDKGAFALSEGPLP